MNQQSFYSAFTTALARLILPTRPLVFLIPAFLSSVLLLNGLLLIFPTLTSPFPPTVPLPLLAGVFGCNAAKPSLIYSVSLSVPGKPHVVTVVVVQETALLFSRAEPPEAGDLDAVRRASILN